LRGGKEAHHLVEGRFDRESVHVGARNHDFADLKLTQFDGAEYEFFFARGEQPAFAGLLDLNLQLLRGMHDAMAARRHYSESFDDRAGHAVEKINRPAKGVEKPLEWPCDHERNAFSASEANGFGNELAEDDVDGAEKQKGERERGRVDQDYGAQTALRGHDALDEAGEGGFAECTDAQAGEGDADLNTGDDAMEVSQKLLDNLGLAIAFGDELAHARLADGDKREFGGGEEAVEDYQEDYADETYQEHPAGESPTGHCSSTGVPLRLSRKGPDRSD